MSYDDLDLDVEHRELAPGGIELETAQRLAGYAGIGALVGAVLGGLLFSTQAWQLWTLVLLGAALGAVVVLRPERPATRTAAPGDGGGARRAHDTAAHPQVREPQPQS